MWISYRQRECELKGLCASWWFLPVRKVLFLSIIFSLPTVWHLNMNVLCFISLDRLRQHPNGCWSPKVEETLVPERSQMVIHGLEPPNSLDHLTAWPFSQERNEFLSYFSITWLSVQITEPISCLAYYSHIICLFYEMNFRIILWNFPKF